MHSATEREQLHRRLWELMDRPENIDSESLKRAFAHHVEYTVCKYRQNIAGPDIFQALAYTVRDFLIDRWNATQDVFREKKVRRIYYLSMEFLLGRLLQTNLVNLGVKQMAGQNLRDLGYDLDEVCQYEPDAGLGNGGLGRLAACFLDSATTLNLPCYGATIRYEYGIFHQQIVNGYQTESPDPWLGRGNPWEILRGDIRYPVSFYGHTDHSRQDKWRPGETVMAQAYDILIPGFDTRTVNNLRLWASRSSNQFNLEYFNHGDYLRAVEDQQRSESISKVLYPNENIMQGKELRLKQEYLLVSATIQDALAVFRSEENDWQRLPQRAFFQLNDTHPALAVAELMRLLMDEHGLDRDAAWDIVSRCTAYTNHTVMGEALERWDVGLMAHLLPRHLEIIYDINHRFLEDLRKKGVPGSVLEKVSIIEEHSGRRVRMANLAVVAATAVNGVAELHTEIIKRDVFADFYRLSPGKFQNKTNGITHRRWLVSANPLLTEHISSRIGTDWITDLDQLRALEQHASDGAFGERWHAIKRENKIALGEIIQFATGVKTNPDSIFDVHIKRIHEYKRQHLNLLRLVGDYQSLRENPDQDYFPRTVIFAGKAAPGYHRAKMIIKLVHSLAGKVNQDPLVRDRLKIIFLPDFSVSLAERLYPAADISEQISTAGTEASGTGNMKFMLNGALTLGTMDGANVEIHQEVGSENIYIFGHTVEEIAELRAAGYDPRGRYNADPLIRSIIDEVAHNPYNHEGPLFADLVRSLLDEGDPYFLLADLHSYRDAQGRVDQDYRKRPDWTRRSILNTARSGKFSSDRTIRDYARDIWKVEPVEQRPPRILASGTVQGT